MIRQESNRTTATKTRLTKLLNRLHITKQPSTSTSNQHYHEYDPKTYRTTTTYSFLPAAIMANNDTTNDNVAETTKNVQLLYVSQKNLY